MMGCTAEVVWSRHNRGQYVCLSNHLNSNSLVQIGIMVAGRIPMKIVSTLCLGFYRKGQELGKIGRHLLPILWVENLIIQIASGISRLTQGVGKGTMNWAQSYHPRVQFHCAAELLKLQFPLKGRFYFLSFAPFCQCRCLSDHPLSQFRKSSKRKTQLHPRFWEWEKR